jgi:hypothetical protein
MRHTICILIVLGILCVVFPQRSIAEDDTEASRVALVKVAFLYNFAKFVEWPAGSFTGPDAPISLCIMGEDSLGTATKTIDGKEIRGRKLVVRLCTRVEEIKGCHILFISLSQKQALESILENIKGNSILTVSELEQFAQRGGIISLMRVSDNYRFEINTKAAYRANLSISSKLLKLALKVYNGEGQED